MKIEFLDESKKEYEKGMTPYDIASSISKGLLKNSVYALVNGEAYDLKRPILKEDRKSVV